MEIDEIKTGLDHPDFQYRLKAIAALKDYPIETAAPLLIGKLQDQHFVVRSFVAMGLSKHQTPEAFTALLTMLTADADGNVRAEAANSLSLFGKTSIPHLVAAFHQDTNWIVRHSILAALVEMDSPAELLDVCTVAFADPDLTVKEIAIDILSTLPDLNQHPNALIALLPLTRAEAASVRMRVARALKQFDHPTAKEALIQLAQDPDPQVVAAALSVGF
jgi:HEAT repeat protein